MKYIVGISLVLLLGIGMLIARSNNSAAPAPQESPTNTVISSEAEIAVRSVVTEFGTKLQMVSLMAPKEERERLMNEHYSRYLAPELLMKWYPEGTEGALGRYSSSPWPDRIEITEVEETGGIYSVKGNVIEVVNAATATKEIAASYPVTFKLENRKGQWFIVEAVKGEYVAAPHNQTLIGFWECVPNKETTGPQTTVCAIGIALDQSDGHMLVNTMLMSRMPIDYPAGTKVRITGVVTPANQLEQPLQYDIDGVINATAIEKL